MIPKRCILLNEKHATTSTSWKSPHHPSVTIDYITNYSSNRGLYQTFHISEYKETGHASVRCARLSRRRTFAAARAINCAIPLRPSRHSTVPMKKCVVDSMNCDSWYVLYGQKNLRPMAVLMTSAMYYTSASNNMRSSDPIPKESISTSLATSKANRGSRLTTVWQCVTLTHEKMSTHQSSANHVFWCLCKNLSQHVIRDAALPKSGTNRRRCCGPLLGRQLNFFCHFQVPHEFLFNNVPVLERQCPCFEADRHSIVSDTCVSPSHIHCTFAWIYSTIVTSIEWR